MAVVGGGPAGMLTARLAASAGLFTTLIEAAPDRPAPQGDHVHRISDETWFGLVALVPSLAEAAAMQGAPVALVGADSLDGELSARVRAFPDRHQLDAALHQVCLGDSGIETIKQRVRDVSFDSELWRVGSIAARWLIDASGGARATLRGAARYGQVEETFSRSEHAYVSQRFEGLAWPDQRVGHAARTGDGALVARRVNSDLSLLTLQFAEAGASHNSIAAVLDHSRQIDPQFGARLALARPVGQPVRWANRRASGLDLDPDLAPPCWFAVGDALLTTPPHQGQGLAQVAEQMGMLKAALNFSETGLADSRDQLFAYARQRLLTSTLVEKLSSAAG